MSLALKLQETRKVSRQDILFCLSREAGSERVVVGSSDAGLHAFDLAEEKPEGQRFDGEGHSSYVTGLARAGDQLISGSWDKSLAWWDAREQRLMRRQEAAHQKWIRAVVASPDASIIASVADDMVCRLWNAQSGELVHELRGHEARTPHHYPSMLFTCAFSPDGSRLATADKVGHIVIWEVASGAVVQTLEAPTMYTWDPKARRHSIGGIRSLAFSPDGTQLAVGGMGQVGNIDHLGGKARLRLFDLEKGDTLAEMESDQVKGLVERIAYHPSGDWFLALGGDHKGLVMLVDPKAGKIVSEEKAPANHAHDFAPNDTWDRIYVAGHHHVTAHDLSTGGTPAEATKAGSKA